MRLSIAALLFVLSSTILAPCSARAAPAHGSPVGASTPVAAVTTLLKPFMHNSAQTTCNEMEGKFTPCPITPRLRTQLAREYRWERRHTMGGNGDSFCRCQNTPMHLRITLMSRAGSIAHVSTRWGFAYNTYTLVYVVIKQRTGWLVDDTYCAGRPATTMYKMPPGPCF